MIYEFGLPMIIDTKNINSTFTKKRHVAKEYIPRIKKISKQRKGVKETLRYLNIMKLEEVPQFHLIEEVVTYADEVIELDPIFIKDYIIRKNWKWTPILTQSRLLRWSESIHYGKSAEIIMARYAAFSACFRSVRTDTIFIKKHLLHKDDMNLFSDMTYSDLMKKTATANKLEEAIMKSIKVHIKAWLLLKKYYTKSTTQFKILANYREKYIENKAAGMEMCLLITKLNTNMLYVEYLRLQGNHEEMGKYAKVIVTQAFLIENLINTYNFTVDPKLLEFIRICQFLYKAIALWSLFFPYTIKLRTDQYEPGEDVNVIAGGCTSFVTYIAHLHHSLIQLPYFKASELYGISCLYYKEVMIPKSQEISKTYSEVFPGYPYDEYHFNKMEELDYMTRMTGDAAF